MKRYRLFLLLFFSMNIVYPKDYIIQSESSEIREVFFPSSDNRRIGEITNKQLKIDIDYFCYYLKYAYADYTSMLEKGFSCQSFKDYFLKKYKSCENIDTKKLIKDFSSYLSEYICDGHFSISGDFDRDINYITKKNCIFFTNTYFQKMDGDFYLFDTDSVELIKNKKYFISEDNLFYYPQKGESVYRLGVLSNININKFEFIIDNEMVSLAVYDDGCIDSGFGLKYHEMETDNTGYVSISSFFLPEKKSYNRKGSEIIFNKFLSLPNKWRDKKTIIIDLRCNKGGEINCIETFLYNLAFSQSEKFNDFNSCIDSFFENNYLEKTICDSFPIQVAKMNFINTYKIPNYKRHKKDSLRKIKEHKKNPQIIQWKRKIDKKSEIKMQFHEKLVFLCDRNSISAAEFFILLAKYIFGQENVVVIGENSFGSLRVGEIYNYLLPESKIFLQLGAEKLDFIYDFQEWHGDGNGIFPDYWSKGEDLNETIFLVTQDEEMKAKLHGIESRLK